LVAGVCVPVRGEDHVRDKIPAFREVVVHERLQEELVDVRATRSACKRPELPEESTQGPGLGLGKENDRGPGAPLSAAELVIGGGGKADRGADTPDDLAWGFRREEYGVIDVPEPGGTVPELALWDAGRPCDETTNVDDRENHSIDQIPVTHGNRNHGLDVQKIGGAVRCAKI